MLEKYKMAKINAKWYLCENIKEDGEGYEVKVSFCGKLVTQWVRKEDVKDGLYK